jgi:hypothetical protein
VLAERLVELDLAIEDCDAWATRPEDVEELRRLEQLRDDLQSALSAHHISRHLRRQLHRDTADRGASETFDPRD